MIKNQIITTLKLHQAQLKKLGVARLAIFGSVARNEATENSDIDLLVTFTQKSAKNYFDLQFYLEDLLEYPIDLVTEQALRQDLRPYIEKELIYIT